MSVNVEETEIFPITWKKESRKFVKVRSEVWRVDFKYCGTYKLISEELKSGHWKNLAKAINVS